MPPKPGKGRRGGTQGHGRGRARKGGYGALRQHRLRPPPRLGPPPAASKDAGDESNGGDAAERIFKRSRRYVKRAITSNADRYVEVGDYEEALEERVRLREHTRALLNQNVEGHATNELWKRRFEAEDDDTLLKFDLSLNLEEIGESIAALPLHAVLSLPEGFELTLDKSTDSSANLSNQHAAKISFQAELQRLSFEESKHANDIKSDDVDILAQLLENAPIVHTRSYNPGSDDELDDLLDAL